MNGHGIRLGARLVAEYTDEDGRRVLEHELYRWECLCGDRGMARFSDPVLAQAGGDRHLIEAGRRAA